MRVRCPALLLSLGMLLVAGPVEAGVPHVTVKDFAYVDATLTVPAGETILWTNAGAVDHTVTSDGGLGLLSFPLVPEADDDFTFTAAGTFPYHCTIHPSMTGRVRVPVRVSPSAGKAGTAFKVILGTEAAPAGYTYVVQRRAPGGRFAAWRTTTAASVTFSTRTKGTWAFRVRLKRTANGAQSAFSPVATAKVR